MNRQELLGKIRTYLARFTEEVKQSNGASQYDINVHAENVLIPLLKEVFDYDGLHNANVKTKNAPAVDLIDYENSASVQVTATADVEKITDTLTKFTQNALYKPFERLHIYIITERQATYRKDFKPLLPDGYNFDPERDIIDNVGLYKYINEHVLNTQKLARIARLLTDEFSDLKIEQRQATNTYKGRTDDKKDRVYPNLLLLTMPQEFYMADLQFDFEKYRQELVAEIKEQKWPWKLRHLTPKEDLKYFFRQLEVPHFTDYVLFENKILTFRNLHKSTEILRKVIDLGTITPLTPTEFIAENLEHEKVFKSLMTSTLSQDLRQRDIEWIHAEKLFRFRMKGQPPRPLKVHWKSKSGKGVIFGVKSKGNETKVTDEDGTERVRKGKHYVCYRHLAFSVTFNQFGGKWYMALKPDWSFTNPKNGYKPSQYADKYAAGIKKIERNGAVLQNFQFLAGYLISIAKGDIVTPGFTIQFAEFPAYFETQPAIPDDVWSQSEPKGKEDKDQLDIDFDE